jgi:hypothetical protein
MHSPVSVENLTFIEHLVKESIVMLCSLLLLLLVLLCFNIMISICIKYYLKESYSFIKLSFTSRREVLHVCNGLYLVNVCYIYMIFSLHVVVGICLTDFSAC